MKLGISFSFMGMWLGIWGAELFGKSPVFLISSLAFVFIGGLFIVMEE